MRIKSLRLKDFRGFVDETLNLDRPVTVLAGPNGSGKSSVIDALCVVANQIYGWFASSGDPIPLLWPAPGDIRMTAARAELDVVLAADSLEIPVTTSLISDEREPTGVHVLTEGIHPLECFFSNALNLPQLRPLLLRYSPARRIEPTWRQPPDKDAPKRTGEWTDAFLDTFGGELGFRPFFRWFREREDIENETKVARRDLAFEDPQLRAVRAAVNGLLPDYSDLRVQREPLHLTVAKGSERFHIDQLSDGEKNLIALAADIACRLAMAHPESDDPLLAEAVIAIDEIELHLHPAWQRTVVGALRRTFPNCQLVLTTHSPQVLSEVPTDAVLYLRDFKAEGPAAPVAGRDTNAILSEVMDVRERPREIASAFDRVGELIDSERLSEARAALDELAKTVTERGGEN